MSQHMEALACANEVRLARAALKHRVAAGERSVADVLHDRPSEVETMTVAALLGSQKRWGRERARRLLAPLRIGEAKPVGGLTDRQREAIIDALAYGPPAEAVDASVMVSPTGTLHLCAHGRTHMACGKPVGVRWHGGSPDDWDDPLRHRCAQCRVASKGWVVS